MHFEAVKSARNVAGLNLHSHAHVVQFYEQDDFLYDAITGFVAGGLTVGQPTIVFARPESRHALSARLARRGLDYDDACRTGQLSVHDARSALATFMRGPMVDEDRFMSEIGAAIEQNLNGRRIGVRAFGEMVDVLFRDGHSSAAIRVEELWNELATRHSFDLLCAYAIGNFYTEAHARQLKDICRRHSRVVPAESYALLRDEEARALKVIELQQRARTLEVEIEHRKAIERALRDALADRQHAKEHAERASAAKSEFLAIISHELRTPLTAIIGYEELIEQGVGGPVTEQQHSFLNGIKAGASHLLRLIDQILTQSRVAAGKEKPQITEVNLSDLVHSCAALLQPVAAERGLELRVATPDFLMVHTDEGKVQQIVLNLVANAVKFTVHGGIEIRLVCDGGSARCDVRDTGVGISAEHLERVFEPFEQVDATSTRTHSGVGLGLSVSRSLARLLGGDVSARSEVGVGSTFSLTLPLA